MSLSRSFSSLRRGVPKPDDVALETDADGLDWFDVLDAESIESFGNFDFSFSVEEGIGELFSL